MSIPRFYCPELNATSSNFLELPTAAHRHAVQVLRLKEGSPIRLFNGQGQEYEAVLEHVTKRNSSAILGEKCTVNIESPLEITLLQGVSRGERMDFALQKAVELGVSRIIPIISERCNVQLSKGRADKRKIHWQGVMISACEQSGRNIVPELCNVMQLEEALALNHVGSCLVLDPLAETGFTTLERQDNIVLLIGPEGGLSEQEIQQAITAGFKAVKFGPRILRTETATVAALAVIQTMWGDLGG
jgi:16S rRNA (uracil1498-N3)-methyltransferase